MTNTESTVTNPSALSVREASELLTVAEVRAIEKRFGGTFGQPVKEGGIGATDMVVGMVWAYERRRALADNPSTLPGWEHLDNFTLRDLNGYFRDEEIEIDEARPETDEGKGD